MTPRRVEALEEFLERLLQRSESAHPLEADELAPLVREIRELLDEVVALSVRVKERAGLSHLHRRIWRQRSVLFHRCREALALLERGEIEPAAELLRAALLVQLYQPRDSFTDDEDQQSE